MRTALTRFGLVVVAQCTLVLAIWLTTHEIWLSIWLGLFLFLGLPLLILTSVDLGRAIRGQPDLSWPVRLIGFALSVPQALLALAMIVIGVSLILWVLYNTFVERLPQYTGGILTFGFGPAMLWLGCSWLRSLFGKADHSATPGA